MLDYVCWRLVMLGYVYIVILFFVCLCGVVLIVLWCCVDSVELVGVKGGGCL